MDAPASAPVLDMLSESFDAEVALLQQYSAVQLPYPSIRPVDNLARWLSITQTQARQRERQQAAERAAAEAKAAQEREFQVDETAHPTHQLNRERFGLLTPEEARIKLEERRAKLLQKQPTVLQKMAGKRRLPTQLLA